jgi:hypothetical protein
VLKQLVSPHPSRYLLPAAVVAGGLFAVALIPVWSLSPRWFAVVIAGLTLVSLTLVLVQRLDDVMLGAYLLLLPLASVQKWLFLDDYPSEVKNVAVLSGAISVGITELLLVGIYGLWFLQVVVARSKPVPRLGWFDGLILLFLVANLLSLPNGEDTKLGLFAIAHLIRHILIYFYFSQRLTARHLPWILVAFAVAIAGESILGVVQYRTGFLSGIILDKGTGSSDVAQYEVPGIENITRATGTSYDSHSYGLFLVMLLPFPLALIMSARHSASRERLMLLALIGLGALGVFASYSRSSWLTLVIAVGIVTFIQMVRREKQIIMKTAILCVLGLLAAPAVLPSIIKRFDAQGRANLDARFDQYPIAWQIWNRNLLTGNGIGNYMVALESYRPDDSLKEPVHNVFLWLAADTGIIGAVMFYVVVGAAMIRLLKVLRAGRAPTDLFALAAFTALAVYVVDGLTNPLFRESLVYTLFWFMLALSVALPRIQAEIDRRHGPATS